jgi:hypothetical protein
MERRKEDLQRASFEINRAPFVHVDSGLHTGLHSAGLGRRPKPIPEAGDKPVLGKVRAPASLVGGGEGSLLTSARACSMPV